MRVDRLQIFTTLLATLLSQCLAKHVNLFCKKSTVKTIKLCTFEGVSINANHTMSFKVANSGFRSRSMICRVVFLNSHLEMIPNQIFTDFENLFRLDVVESELKSLEPHYFHGANNLELLTVVENEVTQLPDNLFEEARGLKRIDLSTNKISEISPTAFEGLYNLKELHLKANEITKIDKEMLRTLENLEVLILKNNQIESLENDLFSENKKLRHVDFENNPISAIGPNIFDNLFEQKSFYINLKSTKCVDEEFKNEFDEDAVFKCTAKYSLNHVHEHVHQLNNKTTHNEIEISKTKEAINQNHVKFQEIMETMLKKVEQKFVEQLNYANETIERLHAKINTLEEKIKSSLVDEDFETTINPLF